MADQDSLKKAEIELAEGESPKQAWKARILFWFLVVFFIAVIVTGLAFTGT